MDNQSLMDRVSRVSGENFGVLTLQPLIEIIGTRRVLIENHAGISCYNCEEIRVNVRFGYISVKGRELRLLCMTSQRVVITGTILGISLSGGEVK